MNGEKPVSRQEIEEAINKAIFAHEIRVAIISGAIGLALLAGTWHAVWIARNQP